MKRLFLTVAIILSLINFADAKKLQIDGKSRDIINVNIEINGQDSQTSLPIFVLNERTYVPVRFVSESLGYKVIWLQSTFTVEIRGTDKKMWLPIGKAKVNLGNGLVDTPDGVKASLVKLPGHVDQFTYVPVRFVAEYLGQKVSWDQATMTVKIGDEIQTPETVDIVTETENSVDNKTEPDKNNLNTARVNLKSVEMSGEDISTPKVFFKFDNKADFNIENQNNFVKITINNADIENSMIGEFNSPLKNSPKYKISKTNNGIEILFTKVGDEISVYKEDDSKTIAVTDSYFFKGIQVGEHNGTKAYVLKGLGKQQYNKMEFEKPKRIAIDLLDSELEGGKYAEFNESIGFVKKVRMSQFVPDKNYNPNDKIIRVVLDIEDGINHPDLKLETINDDLYIFPVESLYDYFKFRNVGTQKYITIKGYDKPINFNYDKNSNTITAQIDKNIPDGVIKYNDSLVKDLNFKNGLLTITLVRNADVTEEAQQEGNAIKITRVKTGNNSDYFILIDPGHGGTDPGGCDFSKTYCEKDLILPVQRSLERKLLNLGYIVKKTNDTVDSYINVRDRAEMANQLKPDILVSLHANTAPSASAKGIEVLYCSEDKNPNKEPGQAKIAQIFTEEILRTTGTDAREIKNRPEIIVVGKTNMSAVLVEMGFLTNPRDLALLKDQSYLEKIVDGIVAAIDRFTTEFR